MANLIPARVMHPRTASKMRYSAQVYMNVAKRIFPVYLSLAVVPAMVCILFDLSIDNTLPC